MRILHTVSGSLLFASLVLGCGGGAPPGDVPSEEVAIRIQNNLNPPTTLTVRAVALRSGTRTLLGTIPPRSTHFFTYKPADFPADDYRLTAVTTTGGRVVSDPFTLSGVTGVRWDVLNNDIRVNSPDRTP